MPTIRANTAVDPSQIASMFDPIAKAFAPPTGQEILAGAKARQTQQQIQYVKDLYDYAAQPGVDQRLLDNRLAVIGQQNGGSSLTAVGMNNATTRATNAADNARALQQTGMQQAGETQRKLLDPVGESQTRFNPSAIVDQYGVAPQQMGVVKLNQGQTAVTPGGQTLAGTPKPVSMDEAQAADYSTLPEMVRQSIVRSKAGVQAVQGESGPVFVMPGDAIGKAPAPTDFKPQIFNYDRPGGGSGTARSSSDGALYDTQTNEKLPQGIKTYTGNLTGSKDETGLGASAIASLQARGLDIANVELTLNNIEGLVQKNPEAFGLTGKVLGLGQDLMSTGKEAAALLGPSLAPAAQKLIQDAENGALPPEMRQRFNNAIPQTKLLEQTLLAQFAKMMDPNGRLSNQQMDVYGKALGIDGMLGNADKTRAVLQMMRQMVEQQRSMITAANAPAGSVRPTNGPAPAAPGGPAPASAAPGQPVRRRYNPATGALE